ncbi:hemolysin family protein [Ruania zhangjianzhongii]|uniref:hemolysin family protein n=1 Tax=Ruania zhangjianzhongii TaxID=2603206 RepID=UPI0011CCD196|nr:hemolysin family protein [Ruania zhangjianzhongii]
MSSPTALLVTVVLLLGNAFFVGAEFAIMSVRRSQVEPLADAGSRSARTVLWALEHVSLMLACAQLGVTVCSVGLGAVAEPAIAHLLEGPLTAVGLPAGASHAVALVIALAIVVYLHVVIGEMVPKNLAVAAPGRAALWFGPPLVWISRVLSPLIRFLNWLANGVLRLVGIEPKDEVTSTFTAEEVAAIVERSRAEGLLQDELGLLTGAIEFSEADAGSVMVSGTGLTTLPIGCTPAEVERAVARTGFSRFPIVEDVTIVGYLHVKDVLYAETPVQRTAPVPPWRVRPLAVAHTDDEIETVLGAMQRTGAHVAGVKGPAGESVGVVFLEDILEELVGEVRDSMQRTR